jgi:hypothetical protein
LDVLLSKKSCALCAYAINVLWQACDHQQCFELRPMLVSCQTECSTLAEKHAESPTLKQTLRMQARLAESTVILYHAAAIMHLTHVLLPLSLLLQAGAGLVADSVPESEYEETLNKAAALGRAIDLAEQAFVQPHCE